MFEGEMLNRKLPSTQLQTFFNIIFNFNETKYEYYTGDLQGVGVMDMKFVMDLYV